MFFFEKTEKKAAKKTKGISAVRKKAPAVEEMKHSNVDDVIGTLVAKRREYIQQAQKINDALSLIASETRADIMVFDINVETANAGV